MTDALRLEELTRSFGRAAPAVNRVDLRLEAGSLFCLLGPSGCGKSTLLRLVGGYLAPDAGRVFLAGADVTDTPLERRDIGMVFQNYALFPHLTARANAAFGLEARGVPRAERRRRVDEMLDRVGVMLGGRLLQVDAPRVLYNCPRTPFVARFLGLANLLKITDVAGDRFHLEGGLALRGKAAQGSWAMIRPEKFVLGPAAEHCPTQWTGRVTGALFLGAQQVLQVTVAPSVTVRVCCRPGEADTGDEVALGVPDDTAWIIPENDP